MKSWHGLDQNNKMANDNIDLEVEAGSNDKSESGMKVIDNDGMLSVFEDEALITRYRYGSDYVRPFFFPVNAPDGRCVTRSYPIETVTGESADHPHHKSLWIAHGDVNGVDNWSEEIGHGFTRHQSIDSIDEGPVCARFSTTSVWCDAGENPLLTQKLAAAFWREDGTARLIDFDIQLVADVRTEDLVFGDTKEGGILSVRVASALDASRGGLISNVYGGKQEEECWGKHSHWCSYSGEIDNQPCGIAVFDHPDSFRSPTTWHVRNYGLMTANPFGYAAFTNGRLNGSHTLKAGNTLNFKYLRYHYDNDPDFNAKCSEESTWISAFPPKVKVLGARP